MRVKFTESVFEKELKQFVDEFEPALEETLAIGQRFIKALSSASYVFDDKGILTLTVSKKYEDLDPIRLTVAVKNIIDPVLDNLAKKYGKFRVKIQFRGE